MVYWTNLGDQSTMKEFHRYMGHRNRKELKKILENNRQLIHPTYRNLDILTSKYIVRVLIDCKSIIINKNPRKKLFEDFPTWLQGKNKEIQLLLHVIDYDDEDSIFKDPLRVSLSNGDLKRVQLLFENGARFRGNILSKGDYKILLINQIFCEAHSNVVEVLRLVLKYYTNINKTILLSSLSECCFLDYKVLIEMSTILIQAGAKINGEQDRTTPLVNALINRRYDLVSFLLENGADVNKICSINTYGRISPIYSAIYFAGHRPAGRPFREKQLLLSTVEKMIEKGVDLDYMYREHFPGGTILHFAIQFSQEDLIPLFVQKGANVSLTDSEGRTPFAMLIDTLVDRFENYYRDRNMLITRFIDPNVMSYFLKEMAMAEFENRKVFPIRDLEIIRRFPVLSALYTKCLNQLDELENTMFYTPYSFLDVLGMRNKNIKKLSDLLPNENFTLNLEANLSLKNPDDLYYEDLNRILKEAKVIRNKYNKLELFLNSILGKYICADVIKLIVDFIKPQDLPTL